MLISCRIYCRLIFAAALCALSTVVAAQPTIEDPDGEFGPVYRHLGIRLQSSIERQNNVLTQLDDLKREPCDSRAVSNLADTLNRLNQRRNAAEALFNFVQKCNSSVGHLHTSADIYLSLADYPKAIEVADYFTRQAPSVGDARYLRGLALHRMGNHERALTDFANAIELFGSNKKEIGSRVFLNMSNAYAALGRHCEAIGPISQWASYDPPNRDTSRTRHMILELEAKGKCANAPANAVERLAASGPNQVITAQVTINGVRGRFIVDTGASYVAVSASFGKKAKLKNTGGSVSLWTANGTTSGAIATADTVVLGKVSANQIPTIVSEVDGKAFAGGADGLLGMSFLTRFDVRLNGRSLEIRARGAANAAPGRK